MVYYCPKAFLSSLPPSSLSLFPLPMWASKSISAIKIIYTEGSFLKLLWLFFKNLLLIEFVLKYLSVDININLMLRF